MMIVDGPVPDMRRDISNHHAYRHHYGDVIVGTMVSQITSLNRLLKFRCRSKKTVKLLVTGLCVGNSPVTGEFSTQMASNAENVSIWWRHHEGSQNPCKIKHIFCTLRQRFQYLYRSQHTFNTCGIVDMSSYTCVNLFLKCIAPNVLKGVHLLLDHIVMVFE